MRLKTQAIIESVNKLNFVKIEIGCASKDWLKK